MVDWDGLQAGLQFWFAATSGIDANNLAWDGEPVGYREVLHADMAFQALAPDVGTDEIRYEPAADGTLVEHVVGNRTLRWVITVRSRDQHPTTRAEAILDRVRTLLAAERSQQMFSALGVAVRESTPVVPVLEVVDGREISTALMTVVLAYTVDEINPLESTVQVIEHVEVGGTVDGVTQPDRELP